MDKWMEHEEPEKPLGYYCGLKLEDFPPANQLKTSDIQTVYKAFRKMLVSWNLRGISKCPAACALLLYCN